MSKQKIKEKIIRSSISLEEYGINNLAWSKESREIARKFLKLIDN